MKTLFSKWMTLLPFNRLLLYLAILGLLPALSVGFHYTMKKKEWEGVLERIEGVNQLSLNYARTQTLNKAVRNVHKEADQFYLENQLETLGFLKKERESLQQLFNNHSFTGNESAQRRYSFIASNANRLEWAQANAQAFDGIQETEVYLSHPVEIDANDLKEILARIEGTRKGKPQLIVTDFRLAKKAHISGNEVFEINLKLLKREFS